MKTDYIMSTDYVVHYIGSGPVTMGLPHSAMSFSSLRTARTWMLKHLKSRHVAIRVNKFHCVERIWKKHPYTRNVMEWDVRNYSHKSLGKGL